MLTIVAYWSGLPVVLGAAGALLGRQGLERAKGGAGRKGMAVAAGEAVFGPSIAQRMMDYFSRPREVRADEVFPQLTEREREILSLIAQGHSNQAIARDLV